MKRTSIFFVLFFASVAMFATSVIEEDEVNMSSNIETPQGGVIEYEGTIGPYPVEFTFMNLHMGNGNEFYYQYKTIKVNKGEPIELVYKREDGKYSVYYEYINGKQTGTFTIIRTNTSITGSFRNSKGQTYKVNAKMVSSNWVDE